MNFGKLRSQYQLMLKNYVLLYGYGLTLYRFSQSEHRMANVLHIGDDMLVKDLERYIPALSSKAIVTFQIAESTQHTAIIPKDMISGESFLTVVTPAECLILGFKGGDPLTNHRVVEEMLSIINDLNAGITSYPEPPLTFSPIAAMATAI